MLLLGWLYWENAIDGVRELLSAWDVIGTALDRLDSMGLKSLRTVLAPAVVVALMLPLVVVACLLLVAALMSPVIARLVAARRFPALQRRADASTWRGVLRWLGRGLLAVLLAVLLLAASLPFWWLSVWAVLLPPLIWGGLAAQLLSAGALASHASAGERRALLKQHRWPLLVIGLVCGALATLPLLLWATGAVAFVLAPLLGVVSVWLYTLVFSFAAAWFTHYLLAELQALRVSVPMPAESLETPARLEVPFPD